MNFRYQLVWSDYINMKLNDKIPALDLLNYDNVCQFNLLYDKNLEMHILNVNTHLFFNVKKGDTKLA